MPMSTWAAQTGLGIIHFSKEDIKLEGSSGENAQRLRALTALPEVLRSIPSNYMVAHNHQEWDPVHSSSVCLKTAAVYSYKLKKNKSLK